MSAICEEERLADIRKKISIIKTIIQKCDYLTNNPVELADPLAATMFLTNESKEVIEEALNNPKTRERRSLLTSYEGLKSKSEKSKILSCHIHEILYDNYVNKRYVMKLKDVCGELEKPDVVANQLDVLKRSGYIWKKLSGDKCVLIEDPEVQAKRIKYLLDMKRFRENNRTFVFVEEKAIPADVATLYEFQNKNQFPDFGKYQYVKIAVSPQLGVIALSIKNTAETFTDWLKNDVTPHLKNSYVLVMDENMVRESPINQPPNPEAKKEDMVKWLERNDIPCCSTMHRAELYQLIDIFKDKLSGEKTFTDEMFKGKGVELLRRPDGWPMLNYFEPLWNMQDLWNPIEAGDVAQVLEKRLELMVEKWSLYKFQQHNNILDDKEINLYEQDMELEEVIDKLFTMARDVDIPDFDLTNYSEVKDDMEKYVKIISGTLDSAAKDKF